MQGKKIAASKKQLHFLFCEEFLNRKIYYNIIIAILQKNLCYDLFGTTITA